MDGVMVGRAAYHQPWDILGQADRLWGDTPPFDSPDQVARAMRPYIFRRAADSILITAFPTATT